MMHLEFTEEEQAFREDVRRFLRERLAPDIRDKVLSGCELTRDDYLMWQRRLYERGWGAMSWPVQFGGAGWNAVQQYIFEEAAALAGRFWMPRFSPRASRESRSSWPRSRSPIFECCAPSATPKHRDRKPRC
jgi:alkylation response protein AidB-like acyl-CoA dehydrogenase